MRKKLLLLVAVVTSAVAVSYAQPRAIGARVGYGVEASYQHTVGKNMVSIDCGLIYGSMYMASPTTWYKDPETGTRIKYHSNGHGYSGGTIGVEAAATYDFIFPINAWKHKGSWNIYAGVGAGIGFMHQCWWHHDGYRASISDGANFGFVGVVGRVGFEYNFWFPLQLSFDWRPNIGPVFQKDFIAYNVSGLTQGAICLGARYRF